MVDQMNRRFIWSTDPRDLWSLADPDPDDLKETHLYIWESQ